MYRVIVSGPDGTEATYALGRDQGLVLGRDETCDIVLPSKKVSRRHARLYTEGERLFIEDMGSQNGLFVGGARLNGTSETRPGPPIEAGEFKIRVVRADGRTNAEAAPPAPRAPAMLRGEGAHRGRTIALPGPNPGDRGFVGREPGSFVWIDNDSVSRRHAEVRLEAGGVHVVTDLGSSNGTFVNGTKMEQDRPLRLAAGDKVRFGETHWLYGSGEAPAGDPLAKRKLLVALAVGLVVLLAVARVFKKPSQQPAPDEIEAAEGEPEVDELMAQGQRAFDDDRFEDARKAFAKVLEANPIHEEALALKQRAENELENQKRFQEGASKANLGRDGEALERYFAIDVDSRYFTRAKLEVQKLVGPVMKRLSGECRESARRKTHAKTLDACGRFLDLKCHSGADDEALKALREAERATGSPTGWVCPPRVAPFFGAAAAQNDGSREIAAKYDDKAVREAVAAYVKGDVEAAVRLLGKETARSPVAKDVLEKMQTAAGRFKEGDTAWRAGNFREMEAAFADALAADAKVLPEGVTSFRGREMQGRITKVYYDAGKTAYDKEAWVEAHDQWTKGLAYNRNDSQLQDALSKLERVALDMLSSGVNCAQLADVVRITRADPPSLAHQKAEKLLAERCE